MSAVFPRKCCLLPKGGRAPALASFPGRHHLADQRYISTKHSAGVRQPDSDSAPERDEVTPWSVKAHVAMTEPSPWQRDLLQQNRRGAGRGRLLLLHWRCCLVQVCTRKIPAG